jgi:hypothetical protein
MSNHTLKQKVCECGTEFMGYHKNGHCPECRQEMKRKWQCATYKKWFKGGSKGKRREHVEFSNDPNMEGAIYL